MRHESTIRTCNPAMHHGELNDLLVELENFTINRVLEIGTHQGGSARVWLRVFRLNLLICVNEANELDEELDAIMIYGRSQDLSTRDSVFAALNVESDDGLVDFLFIDGGHSYDEVSNDFLDYSPCVRPGGVIAFHDIYTDTGVPKFWKAISEQHTYREIRYQGGTGIGVLYV